MTFEQFRATRRAVEDLSRFGSDGPEGTPGFIYCGCLWIADTAGWPTDAPGIGRVGRYSALIGNREHLSNDLTEVERPLYEFAMAEGIKAV